LVLLQEFSILMAGAKVKRALMKSAEAYERFEENN
jgi:hypothetical protein